VVSAATRALVGLLLCLVVVACGGGGAITTPGGGIRANATARWVIAWAAPMQGVASGQSPFPGGVPANQTVRLIAPVSATGDAVRVHLSNTFGTTPVQIGSAALALSSTGPGLAPGSQRELRFSGQPSVTIPPGGEVTSDPVALQVAFGQSLAVSLYVPTAATAASWHLNQPTSSYFTPPGSGDQVADPGAKFTIGNIAVPWLSAVDVRSSESRGAIVVLGDSISNGTNLTSDGQRWTFLLATRLRTLPIGKRQSVVSSAIGGDGLTAAGSAITQVPSGESRLNRDVLRQAGVDEVIVELGVNDEAVGVSAQAMEQALRRIAGQARAAGLRVIAATIPPAAVVPAADRPNGAAVNDWLHTSGTFDGVIEFARAEDPKNTGGLDPAYDSGDHVHPNPAGDQAIANSIPLALVTPQR
jgi:lysophospholipase L1-like esterase